MNMFRARNRRLFGFGGGTEPGGGGRGGEPPAGREVGAALVGETGECGTLWTIGVVGFV